MRVRGSNNRFSPSLYPKFISKEQDGSDWGGAPWLDFHRLDPVVRIPRTGKKNKKNKPPAWVALRKTNRTKQKKKKKRKKKTKTSEPGCFNGLGARLSEVRGNQQPMSLCVYVTEVSALIGYNQHVNLDLAEGQIIQRYAPTYTNQSLELAKTREHNYQQDRELQGIIETFRTEKQGAVDSASAYQGLVKKLFKSRIESGECTSEEFATHVANRDRASAEIRTLRGIHQEKECTHRLEITGAQRVYKKKVFPAGRLYLYGKIDGLDYRTNTLIEIKTRSRPTKGRIWPAEKVQLTCYMFLTGTRTSILLELFEDQCVRTRYDFDEEFWGEIRTLLETVGDKLLETVGGLDKSGGVSPSPNPGVAA
jgi:hypothetical protein